MKDVISLLPTQHCWGINLVEQCMHSQKALCAPHLMWLLCDAPRLCELLVVQGLGAAVIATSASWTSTALRASR